MRGFTQVKSHIHARLVTRNSQNHILWRLMRGLTQVKSHNYVNFVIRSTQFHIIWRIVRGFTEVKSHIYARIVTRNSPNHKPTSAMPLLDLGIQLSWRTMMSSVWILQSYRHFNSRFYLWRLDQPVPGKTVTLTLVKLMWWNQEKEFATKRQMMTFFIVKVCFDFLQYFMFK